MNNGVLAWSGNRGPPIPSDSYSFGKGPKGASGFWSKGIHNGVGHENDGFGNSG